MKTVPLTFAAALTLLAAPLLQSAEPAKKPAKPAPAVKPEAKPVPPVESPEKPAAAALPDVVAVVEGKEIKGSELQAAVVTMLARQGAPPDAVPEERRSEVYHRILDNLIVVRLVEKRSKDIKVAGEEVTATFDKLKAGFGTEEEFKKQMELRGQTVETVQAGIRDSLRQQHWVDEQVKGSKKMTDADAEAYYKENPDQFKQPEEVRASHILIAVPQDAKPEVVVQKEKAAQAVLTRVKGGEDFAKVAKEISEDPSAKTNGGDLDFFTKDKMVPEFAEAAFAMKKDTISAEPVRSNFGYHIIKVTDRKDSGAIPLETVKPQVVDFLQDRQHKLDVNKMLQEMRATADVKVSLP